MRVVTTLGVIGVLMMFAGVGSLLILYLADPDISVGDMFRNYWWVWVLSLSCMGVGLLLMVSTL